MAATGFFRGGGRFRELLRKYGKVALGVHLSVSAASIAGLYVAIKNNVDVETMLENMGIEPKPSEDQQIIDQSHTIDIGAGDPVQADGSADQIAQKTRNRTADLALTSGGALAMAVLCNKALFPIRVPITIALTPPIAKFLRARNIIKKVV